MTSKAGKAAATLWISKRIGATVREEVDFDIVGKGKGHQSIRFDYTSVQPAADVK